MWREGRTGIPSVYPPFLYVRTIAILSIGDDILEHFIHSPEVRLGQ